MKVIVYYGYNNYYSMHVTRCDYSFIMGYIILLLIHSYILVTIVVMVTNLAAGCGNFLMSLSVKGLLRHYSVVIP